MGGLVRDSKEKAQLLCDQFKSTFTEDTGETHFPHTTKRFSIQTPPLPINTIGVE
ncbi:hypothetical protein DPMN_000924 [Dreissena polymorpha]|uniref:Uncharacterized protein n=1 Tax=Dreissena polymorpha TaxID=45954 RepID=A0A9D4MHK3_DREPO|nr:hypothetical protein DPMN_000924 [Dreissena polymorpha]